MHATRRMSVDQAEFRRVMGHWATGVAVVSTRLPDGQPRGFTANAVTSVSLDPPLVLVCIERSSETYHCILEAGVFCINMLDAGHERLARQFSGKRAGEKFADVAYHGEVTGCPVLDEALAWVDCRLFGTSEAGDHTIFLGEVVAAGARAGEPLLYFRGGFGAG
jgi:flavin reductase (DIM6/NTAB) family NADH-FMN oxidoreductase RutF